MPNATTTKEEFFLLIFEVEGKNKGEKGHKNVCDVFDEIREQLSKIKNKKEFAYDEMRYGNKGCMLIMLKTCDAEKNLRNFLEKLEGIRLLDLHVLDTLLQTPFDEFIKLSSPK